MTATAEVATIDAGANTLQARMQYARALAEASLLPSHYRKNPANVLLAMEYGDALGMHRVEAINSIHVVDGKPTMSADLMAARVRMAGHKLRVVENAAEGAVEAHLIRADDPDFTFIARWDDQKMRDAGLAGKQNWKAYKLQMMRARAVSEVCRMGANDALHGIVYVPEELGAPVEEDGTPIYSAHVSPPAASEGVAVDPATAEVIDTNDETATWYALLDAAESVEQVKTLWRQLADAGVQDADLRAAVTARGTELAQQAQGAPEHADDGVVDAEVVEDEPVEATEREIRAHQEAFDTDSEDHQ